MLQFSAHLTRAERALLERPRRDAVRNDGRAAPPLSDFLRQRVYSFQTWWTSTTSQSFVVNAAGATVIGSSAAETVNVQRSLHVLLAVCWLRLQKGDS